MRAGSKIWDLEAVRKVHTSSKREFNYGSVVGIKRSGSEMLQGFSYNIVTDIMAEKILHSGCLPGGQESSFERLLSKPRSQGIHSVMYRRTGCHKRKVAALRLPRFDRWKNCSEAAIK